MSASLPHCCLREYYIIKRQTHGYTKKLSYGLASIKTFRLFLSTTGLSYLLDFEYHKLKAKFQPEIIATFSPNSQSNHHFSITATMRFFGTFVGVVAMLLCMVAALPTTGDIQSDKSVQVAASAATAAEASSKVDVPVNGTTQSFKRGDEYNEGIWGCSKRGWSDYCQHWHSDDIHMCHSTAFDRDRKFPMHLHSFAWFSAIDHLIL